MTTENLEGQRQDDVPEDSTQEGAPLDADRLTAAESTGDQTGAGPEEQVDAKTERSYSAAEVAKIEGTKQREINALHAAAAAREQEIEQRQAQWVEQQYQTRDTQAVQDGDITPDEAGQRRQLRNDYAREQADHKVLKAENDQYRAAKESEARIEVARRLGLETGVSPERLLENPNLSPDQMDALALRLEKEDARAAAKGTETFDTNQVGGAPTKDIASMTSQEKIAEGLRRAERAAARRR